MEIRRPRAWGFLGCYARPRATGGCSSATSSGRRRGACRGVPSEIDRRMDATRAIAHQVCRGVSPRALPLNAQHRSSSQRRGSCEIARNPLFRRSSTGAERPHRGPRTTRPGTSRFTPPVSFSRPALALASTEPASGAACYLLANASLAPSSAAPHAARVPMLASVSLSGHRSVASLSGHRSVGIAQ